MPPHLGLKCKTVNKVFVNPLLLSALHIYCSTAEMMSVSETTYTRTAPRDTSFGQGNLHRGANHLPGRAAPDAG